MVLHPLRLRDAAIFVILLLSSTHSSSSALAEDTDDPPSTGSASSGVLSAEGWNTVDESVDRALAWLARQQKADGSFPSSDSGQPAVTALCLLAFLSDGHLPGEGDYGATIDAGINFVLSCQQAKGVISYRPIPHHHVPHEPGHTGIYNHAIGGLLLTEVYGMLDSERSSRIRPMVEAAIEYTRTKQTEPKENPIDNGGWRYIHRWNQARSDLSVTSWQLLFWRSGKNAGFEIPSEWIDEAMDYVLRSYDEREGVFLYALHGPDRTYGRGMVAAGILALSLGGMHDTPMARRAGDWILAHPVDRYNQTVMGHDRFHYGVFYCSQAMLQLGGQYWDRFYPQMVKTVTENQSPQGWWIPEEAGGDRIYGNAYTSALMVLALTAPYQLLPIFQR